MRLLLLMSALAMIAESAAARPVMAFHYARPLTDAQLAHYAKFELLVTHDPLPRAQVDALHARGTRVLLYEWAVAFYPSIATRWQRGLSPSSLLNAHPLRGHLGAPDIDAFYYDPASIEHARDRAPALASKLRAIGYDGVFLDTTTHASVHPAALAEFARRHPGLDYDVAFARFLRALRRELRDGVIATNQGYRAAKHVLPFVDVDVSESLITRPVNGKFVLRRWLDERDEWNSIAYLMHHLIAPAQRAYPRVRFVHLNYVDALDERAVEEISAIARLYDADAFIATPTLTQGTALLFDFGRARPRVETRRTAYRVFEHAIVAANFSDTPLKIPKTRIVVAPHSAGVFRR